MSSAPFHLAGERLMLDPGGGMFWPAQRLLAVADLHFEKASAAAMRGSLLPPWDTRATLDRLAALLRRYRPQRVVALGDSFHDAQGSGRMQPQDQARLAAMVGWAEFTWVLGNHDPTPPVGIGGAVTAALHLGPFVFRHEGEAGVFRHDGEAGVFRHDGEAGDGAAELCGHHHPKANIATKAAVVTRPCFVADARRLMLPSLGAFTGGLDVRHPAIAALFPRGGRVFLLGRDRLFSFAMPRHAQPSQKPALTGRARIAAA